MFFISSASNPPSQEKYSIKIMGHRSNHLETRMDRIGTRNQGAVFANWFLSVYWNCVFCCYETAAILRYPPFSGKTGVFTEYLFFSSFTRIYIHYSWAATTGVKSVVRTRT